MNKEIEMGQATTFDSVTLTQEPSGGWRLAWGVSWHFSELADALEREGVVLAAMRATGMYRVRVRIEPERGMPDDADEPDEVTA